MEENERQQVDAQMEKFEKQNARKKFNIENKFAECSRVDNFRQQQAVQADDSGTGERVGTDKQ